MFPKILAFRLDCVKALTVTMDRDFEVVLLRKRGRPKKVKPSRNIEEQVAVGEEDSGVPKEVVSTPVASNEN